MPDDLVIDPNDDLGSPRLAEALRARDSDAIGRALRQDVVVMPELTTAEGERQVRVFPSRDAARPYALLLFSTVARMADFLPEETGRQFSLADGEHLADFLRTWDPQLAAVVIDPGADHAMEAPVAEVLASLAPRDEDAVGWIDQAVPAPRASGSGPALVPDLVPDWVPVDLHAPQDAEQSRLASRLEALKVDRRRAPQLREWLAAELPRLRRDAPTAAAVLFTGRRSSATTLSLASFAADREPLDAVAARIGSDGVDRLRSPEGELLRRQAIEEGGPGGPVLVVDYWRRHPSGAGVARLEFTAPLSDDEANGILVAGILRLADSIATTVTWGPGS